MRLLSVRVELGSPGLALGPDLEEGGEGVGHQLLQGEAELHVMHLGVALASTEGAWKVAWKAALTDYRMDR